MPEGEGAGRPSAGGDLPVARRTHASSNGGSPAGERVLFVTPEIADYVKAGGLGEVSATLPRALRAHCDVRVLVPGYRQLTQGDIGIRAICRLPAVGGLPACDLGRIDTPDGLVIYVVLSPELYDREGGPYGDGEGHDWPDNDVRFARLSLSASEMACGRGEPGWQPDVLHLNDWPAGLAAGYLSWRGRPVPTLLTIHNLAYQGLFDRRRLAHLGIPSQAFDVNGVEFHGRLSFLKTGIYYASHVTTVSATYAREITTPQLGCGLDGLLSERASQGRLSGILNGIDGSWNPEDDPHLASRFYAGDWRSKRANAEQVQADFGLALSRGPLFAIVSRLVHQKGVDVAIEAAESILGQGGQIVATGRGEARLETAMLTLAERHPDQVGVRIGYDEAEARRVYAASDFLLMPSRFEPCGLSQMYAQKFGSLPIAHRTGGLADTIEDGSTGFLFGELSVANLKQAIKRALQVFGSRQQLDAMRRMAMARPFDWHPSALRYAALYRAHSVLRR